MSDILQLHCDVLEWTITGTSATETNDRFIRALDIALREWRQRTALDTFEISETTPLVYAYEIKHTDLREVSGSIDFTGDPLNPLININCPDLWDIDELFREEVRDPIINVVANLGLTSLDVKFF